MTDPAGASATATVHISVGNTPPVATIAAPAEGAKYRGGVPVTLTGSGTDKEDGTLADAKLSWHVVLVHADHAHDFITLTGKNASFTPATDHDADSYYRVTLTATDSKGVSTSKTVTIVPQTIDLTIASVPAGAPITYAGYPQVAASVQRQGRDRVSARQSAPRSGSPTTVASIVFDGWSDGGAISHDVSDPGTGPRPDGALPRHRPGAVQRHVGRARAGRRQAWPRDPAAVAQAGAQAGRHGERPGGV